MDQVLNGQVTVNGLFELAADHTELHGVLDRLHHAVCDLKDVENRSIVPRQYLRTQNINVVGGQYTGYLGKEAGVVVGYDIELRIAASSRLMPFGNDLVPFHPQPH